MAVDYATLKKGGFMRQKQKNNFSLRLRVVGGNLTAVQLVAIAEVAEKFGDGHVHLTSRQSVEIPFVKLDQIDAVKAALAKGGVEPGVCGPRVRTITACQGETICPSGCIDTYALAKELDERYFAKELPHKFKFGITGCQNNCLKSEENDLGIKGGIQVKWREEDCIPVHTRGRLTTGFSKPSKGTRFLRARALGGLVEIPGEGNAEAHSSGSLSAMMGCNCLVELPAGSGPVAPGEEVEVLNFVQ